MSVVLLMQEQQEFKKTPPNQKNPTPPPHSPFLVIFSSGTKEKPNIDLKGKCFFFPLSKQADLEVLPAKLTLTFGGFSDILVSGLKESEKSIAKIKL